MLSPRSLSSPSKPLRAFEGQQLDRLRAALLAKALDGDEKAAAVLVRISDRRARLFGLDAPMQIEAAQPMTVTVDPRLLPASFNPAALDPPPEHTGRQYPAM